MIAHAAMFETNDKAEASSAELAENGFPRADILVLKPLVDGASDDDTDDPNVQTFIKGMECRVRDARVDGKWVVITKPAYYRAGTAVEIFEKHGATKVVVGPSQAPRFLSDVLRIPLISTRRPVV